MDNIGLKNNKNKNYDESIILFVKKLMHRVFQWMKYMCLYLKSLHLNSKEIRMAQFASKSVVFLSANMISYQTKLRPIIVILYNCVTIVKQNQRIFIYSRWWNDPRILWKNQMN